MKTLSLLSTLMVISFMSITSFQAHAQSENSEESATFSHAKTILQKMSNYLAQAEQFSFFATITEDQYYQDDYYIESESTSNIVIRHPNKVYAEIISEYNHKQFWYDGAGITLLTVTVNFYAQAEVSGNIDEMIGFVFDKYGVKLPLAGFAFTSPYELLIEAVTDGYYYDNHKINGINCHHLLFVEEDVNWEIWIEKGSEMVPRKYVVTFKNMDGGPKFSAEINEWNFNPYTPDEMFNFTPPSGAEKIDFVTYYE